MHGTCVEVRGQLYIEPEDLRIELRSPGSVTSAEPSHQLSFISLFTIHSFTYPFINSLSIH